MLLALLAACANVTLEGELASCADADADNPAESELVAEVEGDAARVYRSNDYRAGAGATWDPVIAIEGKVVHVYEQWSGGEGADPTCYEPGLAISGLTGTLQVRWYLSPDDSLPWDTVDLKGE